MSLAARVQAAIQAFRAPAPPLAIVPTVYVPPVALDDPGIYAAPVVVSEKVQGEIVHDQAAEHVRRHRSIYRETTTRYPDHHEFPSPQNLRDAGAIIQEAYPTANYGALSNIIDRDGFQQHNNALRDMPENTRLKILSRAETLVTINPLANRGVSIRTDFVVSEGYRPIATSKDPEYNKLVQRVLDDYWGDNDWEKEMFSRILDAGITGEVVRRIPPLNVKIKGLPDRFDLPSYTCGNLFPYAIDRILLDPWNYERQEHVIFHPHYFPAGANTTYRLVRKDRVTPQDFRRVSGEVFYLGFNRRTGQSRGLSDLTPCIEWLDMHDEALYTDAERVAVLMRFIWDITLEGASEKECESYSQKLRKKPPRAGTSVVHDEKEKWAALSPDLQISESAQSREAIFDYAMGGMGLPKNYFVDSENINRSNGEEMKTPVFAWARTRRNILKHHFELECQMAVQVARDNGRLSRVPAEECGFIIMARDPDRSNYDTVGDALKNMGDALTVAVASKFCSEKQAKGIWQTMAGSVGFELEDEEAQGGVQTDDGTSAAARFANQNDPLQKKLATALGGGAPEGEEKPETGRTLESVQRETWDRLRRQRSILRTGRVDPDMENWLRQGTVERHLSPVRRKIHLVAR